MSNPNPIDINTPADKILEAATASPPPTSDHSTAQAGLAGASPSPSPQPFTMENLEGGKVKVTLQTGEEFSGTPIEVTQKIAASKVDTTLWARGMKQQLETQAAQAQQDLSLAETPADAAAASARLQEIQNRYFQLVQSDPAQATLYGLASALDMTPEEFVSTLKDVVGTTRAVQGESIAVQFKAQFPDFPDTDEAAGKLITVLEQANLPITPQTLGMAHTLCVRNGVYKPLPAQQQQQTQSGPIPPPIPPGSAPAPGAGEPDPWKMPLNDLRTAVLNSKK